MAEVEFAVRQLASVATGSITANAADAANGISVWIGFRPTSVTLQRTVGTDAVLMWNEGMGADKAMQLVAAGVAFLTSSAISFVVDEGTDALGFFIDAALVTDGDVFYFDAK